MTGLSTRELNLFVSTLQNDLGRTFREFLWAGKRLLVNGEEVKPVDPLFLRPGRNMVGAQPYGEPIHYDIKIPGGESVSTVSLRFVELPIENWYTFSNQEKRSWGIAKGAGVSILRGGREIDYGWFFAGNKRKENYDDWWRCEIHFSPILDELFGITHTKQEIHPSEIITHLLSPDIEQIAHQLNRRVRQAFVLAKKATAELPSEKQAGESDCRLEPPGRMDPSSTSAETTSCKPPRNLCDQQHYHAGLPGLKYKILVKALEDLSFFRWTVRDGLLTLELNEEHPFVAEIYLPSISEKKLYGTSLQSSIELLLLAFARAQEGLKNKDNEVPYEQLQEEWSDCLSTFLT